ncbi:hypothetical protein E4T39_02395 [Aureobasidium subglaciale]|nr:hypothetical protein E4T39_02395 [Aureobasidium subglaciale]
MAAFRSNSKARVQKILGQSSRPPRMASNMHVALPLYMYSSAGTWQPLYNALSNNPQVTFDVIINPNNGPGGSLPDSNYIPNITMINSYHNVNMLGYIHTSYGSRNLSDIASDIDTYQSWSTYTNSNISLGGVPVDASFYNIADMINAYENSYDHWMNQGGNSSIPAAVRSKSTVLLHSYPSNTHTMASDVDKLVKASYLGALLIVDDQYSSFDSMWPMFTSEVGQSNAKMKC